jgi:hypothetical protein
MPTQADFARAVALRQAATEAERAQGIIDIEEITELS